MSAAPIAKKRLDYRSPDFLISNVNMEFFLEENHTKVVTRTQVSRNGHHSNSLSLDGQDLELVRVELDGKAWQDYDVQETGLIVNNVGDTFELVVETLIDPANNTSLEGLYQSSGAFCTQCEAEGFRKITYFLDRPDVLAEYTVTIHADKDKYPYLLSNGNKIDAGVGENNSHFVTWHDPHKKPCYLFALVAGDFDLLTDEFVTQSGRNVALELFVDKGKLARGQHALDSLKKSMAWDEQVFGLEYDLDIYMIVAVDFFNMGAMENKGLNVFNSKFVLADADSATDEDYFNIESVIAHEYFHNWTGNRVTCRDWFQLSLKEGLTVFRDQQFSADMSSAIVNRIKNVRVIREHQFAEDAGPMSHPIRPDEVVEMNNFYTVTVYDKGAEVIRMMHTLLGQSGFRKGMDLYFKRHDGQAVTCDDFVQAMEDASGISLEQFRRWYSQSGTPVVNVSDNLDASDATYQLTFEQVNNKTADQQAKQNLHIPVQVELLGQQGQHVALNEDKTVTTVFDLKEAKQSIEVTGLDEKPIPVVLGNFSAPVKVNYPYDGEELSHIAKFAKDEFARWDAAQQLFSKYIHSVAGNPLVPHDVHITRNQLTQLVDALIKQSETQPALIAEMLSIPSFETLCQQAEKYDVEKLYKARESVVTQIGQDAQAGFLSIVESKTHQPYAYNQGQVNNRRLSNIALRYLASTEQGTDLIKEQYQSADNMTDTLGALKASQACSLSQFDSLMQEFEERWRDDPLVLDKWFSLHASTHREDILSRLDLLMSHRQFTINNPNRVRSLVGTFTFYNPMGFHNIDGSGYRYVTDYLLKLDEVNPQVAARIVTPLTQWQVLDGQRQDLMRHQLARLADKPNLSKDVLEKVTKSLNFKP